MALGLTNCQFCYFLLYYEGKKISDYLQGVRITFSHTNNVV